MYSKFTNRLQNVLDRAKNLAILRLKNEVEVEDVFLSLSQEKGSLAGEILLKSGVSLKRELKEDSENSLNSNKKIIVSENVKKILNKAVTLAADMSHKYIGTEHLLFAILNNTDDKTLKFFNQTKIDIQKLSSNLKTIFKTQTKFSENEELQDLKPALFEAIEKNLFEEEKMFDEKDIPEIDEIIPPAFESSFRKEKNKGPLEVFGRELTDKKLQQTIDPVILRDKEIARIIQILGRRNKNNPVLLGDPGVGKTAIVEGLAKKIIQGEVPQALINKKIYSLDINLIIAGAMMRGEFEMRLKQIIDAARENSNIILFIDEIHTIVGTGAMMGAMDAANILKPALARGEIRCIGATTWEDYKKYIEDDPALERRFQPVDVAEPSVAETIEILQGIRKNYEQHHLVKISDSATVAAAYLADRYIPERFLPDKAIDLIDEACSAFKVSGKKSSQEKKIEQLENRLNQFVEAKVKAAKQENYAQAISFKEQELEILNQLIRFKQNMRQSQDSWLGEITEKEIASIVSSMKKIPLRELKIKEGKKIAGLENNIKKFIIGQNEALEQISFFIKRSRAGLTSGKRPLGSFIFLGPSGVGKTETAKVLAREVFGGKDKLIRLDMSEFSESFNLSRLIGSPPGYVGFKEGGKLTESVKRNPYAVVLFDEVEKAHPQVLNILLQILEDGQLTDAVGKKVSFKNTIIILTSNLGLADMQKGVGFSKTEKDGQEFYKSLSLAAEKALKEKFNPEFLNRFDKIIYFKPLSPQSFIKIVKLELFNLSQKLEDKNIKVTFSPQIIRWLAKKSYSPEFGAR